MATTKGFIKDFYGNRLLPITRAELVLDSQGQVALTSALFAAGATINGKTNDYGLISAADLAKISGNGGESLSDIYKKLGNINSGLYVKNQAVAFYNETGTKTPIHLLTDDSINIVVVTAEDGSTNITFKLPEVNTAVISETNTILKGITVDKQGRVTSVSAGALTNTEIPKDLQDKNLIGCTTPDLDGTAQNQSIVNKKYVDELFDTANRVATGALKFGGSLSSKTTAEGKLDASNNNYYYKVTGDFVLSAGSVHDVDEEISVRSGDTLIVYHSAGSYKFVHIPSGDDLTRITIKENGTDEIVKSTGAITLDFSGPLAVETDDVTNKATISVNKVSTSQDGYLSKDDYTRFLEYSGKTVSYTPTVTSTTTGKYEIGKLNLGAGDVSVYGVNNLTDLALENVTENNASIPSLKFTETGAAAKEFKFKGVNGVVVSSENNTITFAANNTVATGSEDYLSITNGHTFGVTLGSCNDKFEITDGLATVSVVQEMITNYASHFEIVADSLTSSSSKYHYGSTDLVSAINVTI